MHPAKRSFAVGDQVNTMQDLCRTCNVNASVILLVISREIYKNTTQKFQYAENAIGSN